MDIIADANEAILALKQRNSNFPNRWCKEAAKEMHRRGYPIIVGTVELSTYCELGSPPPRRHYWNYIPEDGRNIDISASQFNPQLRDNVRLDEIAIWSDSDGSIYSKVYSPIERGISPDMVL